MPALIMQYPLCLDEWIRLLEEHKERLRHMFDSCGTLRLVDVPFIIAPGFGYPMLIKSLTCSATQVRVNETINSAKLDQLHGFFGPKPQKVSDEKQVVSIFGITNKGQWLHGKIHFTYWSSRFVINLIEVHLVDNVGEVLNKVLPGKPGHTAYRLYQVLLKCHESTLDHLQSKVEIVGGALEELTYDLSRAASLVDPEKEEVVLTIFGDCLSNPNVQLLKRDHKLGLSTVRAWVNEGEDVCRHCGSIFQSEKPTEPIILCPMCGNPWLYRIHEAYLLHHAAMPTSNRVSNIKGIDAGVIADIKLQPGEEPCWRCGTPALTQEVEDSTCPYCEKPFFD